MEAGEEAWVGSAVAGAQPMAAEAEAGAGPPTAAARPMEAVPAAGAGPAPGKSEVGKLAWRTVQSSSLRCRSLARRGHQGTAMATAPTTAEAEAAEAVPAGSGQRSRAARWARRAAPATLQRARAALRSVWAARPKRRIRPIDVLRVLGLARRAVPRPVVGPRAYPRWWQRMLALLMLIGMVAGIGFGLAALVGFVVVLAGFLLEQAIS